MQPAVVEAGDEFLHLTILRAERTLFNPGEAGFINLGLSLFEEYRLNTGGEHHPVGLSEEEMKFSAILSPTIAIGRRLSVERDAGIECRAVYGWLPGESHSAYPTEPFFEVSGSVKVGWGYLKAGAFRGERPRFRKEHYHRDDFPTLPPYQGAPLLAYYLSIGVGPSFRF